jgi:anti-sigma-K factor RskA
MLLLDQNRRQIESLRMQVVRHDELIGSLQTTIQATGKTMRMLESPSVQVVAALGTEVQPTASARVFLDKSQGAVSFYASGLKPLPADKTYELWLINDKQKPIAAGTFDVNRAGEASLERKVPAEAGHIVLVAVTEEPAGGVPQPTGAIQIKGTIQ